MKATELKLIDFLRKQETQFVIPVYQRNYDWTFKQCSKLLEDIISIAEEAGENDTHFIGSIVFIQKGVYNSGLNQLVIIDGQQRLTTIMLLWIALFHKAKEFGQEKVADKIKNMYLINQYLDDEEKVKLKPTENNAQALSNLLSHHNSFDDLDDSLTINQNFKYFFSKINKENLSIIEQGIGRLIFVEISLEKGKDDPQKIFESLNSTGLALNQADLIRNYILMDLEYKLQEKVYKNYWLPIEEFTKNLETSENELSDFIRHFLSFKLRDVPSKSKVYETFKKNYKITDEIELEKLLQEIKTYAQYYHYLVNPELEKDKNINKHLKFINQLEISVSYPFLLEVYHDYSTKVIDTQTFIEVLELVQSFVWRRFICDLATNSLNKIFLRLYLAVKDKSKYIEELQRYLVKLTSTQRFPNDIEVKRELEYKNIYKLQSKNRMYLFYRLENYNNNEPVQIEDNEKITIEHIFPKTPSPVWKSLVSEQDYKELSEKYLDTLGNLTLSGNNSALSNKSFAEKRDLEHKGYKDSKLFLNKFLAQQNQWNVEILKKRLDVLTERFKEIWKYPGSAILEDTDNEINIFDIDNPTGELLEYYVFDGKRVITNTFKDILRNISKQFYSLDKEYFLQSKIKNKLKVTSNKEALTFPVELSDGIYIESSLSSKEIFKRVKLLLQVYGFEDDLFIKFKNIDDTSLFT